MPYFFFRWFSQAIVFCIQIGSVFIFFFIKKKKKKLMPIVSAAQFNEASAHQITMKLFEGYENVWDIWFADYLMRSVDKPTAMHSYMKFSWNLYLWWKECVRFVNWRRHFTRLFKSFHASCVFYFVPQIDETVRLSAQNIWIGSFLYITLIYN